MEQENVRLSRLRKARLVLKIIGLLWTYATISMFISFGVKTIASGGEPKFLAYLIFVISAIYFAVETVMFFLQDKSKEAKKRNRSIKKTFGLITKLIKLTFAVVSIISITGILNWTVMQSHFLTILTILWLSLTITLETVTEINKFILKKVLALAKGKISRMKKKEEEEYGAIDVD